MTMRRMECSLYGAMVFIALVFSQGSSVHGLSDLPDGTVKGPVMVEFEYQIEVNGGRSSRDVLARIDKIILNGLQAMLPQNEIIESASSNLDVNISQMWPSMPDGDRPNWWHDGIPSALIFDRISSQQYSACFTSAEVCGLVRSKLQIAFDGKKPQHSVERVAIRLVQDFLQFYDAQDDQINITYMYPFFFTSAIRLEVGPVQGEMTDVEKWVMEDSFMGVFGVVVDTVEGDTRILDVNFVYQDVIEFNATEQIDEQVLDAEGVESLRNNETDQNTTVLTIANSTAVDTKSNQPVTYTVGAKFQFLVSCRDCSTTKFSAMTNAIIQGNLDAYRTKLVRTGKQIDTVYFENVTEVEFGIPKLPHFMDPTDRENLYDGAAPTADKEEYPWFFFVGIAISACILIAGGCFIRRELKYYAEDDSAYSTSSESQLSQDRSVGSHRSRSKMKDGTKIEANNGDDNVSLDRPINPNTSSNRNSTRRNFRPSASSAGARRLDPTGMIHEYSIEEGGDHGIVNDQTSLEEYQIETIMSAYAPDDSTIESVYKDVGYAL